MNLKIIPTRNPIEIIDLTRDDSPPPLAFESDIEIVTIDSDSESSNSNSDSTTKFLKSPTSYDEAVVALLFLNSGKQADSTFNILYGDAP